MSSICLKSDNREKMILNLTFCCQFSTQSDHKTESVTKIYVTLPIEFEQSIAIERRDEEWYFSCLNFAPQTIKCLETRQLIKIEKRCFRSNLISRKINISWWLNRIPPAEQTVFNFFELATPTT